jgi:hypothetical protein
MKSKKKKPSIPVPTAPAMKTSAETEPECITQLPIFDETEEYPKRPKGEEVEVQYECPVQPGAMVQAPMPSQASPTAGQPHNRWRIIG